MEQSVSPDKKHWIKPRVRPLDQSAFNHWDRDKLVRARDLVQSALELVEMSGDAPKAATAIRAVLSDLQALLAE